MYWQSSPCSLLQPAEGKPNVFVEPLVTSVKAFSFRVKTFIETQKLYTLQFHCQGEFFLNFSCKIYVADAEKHWPLNLIVLQLMKICLQRQQLPELGTPPLFPGPVSYWLL